MKSCLVNRARVVVATHIIIVSLAIVNNVPLE